MLGRGGEWRIPAQNSYVTVPITSSTISLTVILKNQAKGREGGGGSHYLQNRHFAKLLKASSKTPAIQGKGEEEEKRRRRKGSQEKKVSKTTVWKRKKKQLHTPPTTPPSSLRPFSLAAAAGFQEQDRWVANKQHGGKTRVISSMLRSRAAPRCSLKRRCILFPPTACNLVVQLSSLPSIPPSSIKKKHCLRAVRHQQQQQPCRLLLLRGSGIHGI